MNSIRVIFVDDEPRVLEGLKRMLRPKRNEWDMTFVNSAQAALDALREQPREVVVTDMRMPGMSGAELLEVVQRDYPDTIRLILSGQAETDSVMKALGVSHQFLSKPCDAEILQGTISRAFALRDLAGNSAVKTLVARINKLPTLPATYQKLVDCLKDPNSSMDEVAQIISRDPAMTARLLKVVNSAYFGLAKPVADVSRAGSLLGIDRIMALVLGQGIFSGAEVPKVPGFSLDALWAHSVATATAAHRIAIEEDLEKDRISAAFLAGMLHDLGKLVLAMGMPEHYGRVLAAAQTAPARELEFEMLELQASHSDVGAYLVGLWGLPNTIAEAIAYHEDPGQSKVASFGLPGIVHVADRIAHHPDVADPNAPELCLNVEYLAKNNRAGHWNQWRELCCDALAQGNAK
ncbi:MAG TPA: response regulator [Steroidobacteraceae bacterium]|nr:response regulator [Steroidobacteraceae bacterium]